VSLQDCSNLRPVVSLLTSQYLGILVHTRILKNASNKICRNIENDIFDVFDVRFCSSASVRLLIQILKTRMHLEPDAKHELVFKNQPPFRGGCQKRTFGNLIPRAF
jgi:hypothetical protein